MLSSAPPRREDLCLLQNGRDRPPQSAIAGGNRQSIEGVGDIVSTSTVSYFVDTNLFLQCHPLEQLDWTLWNGFEEVRLIVSSPVLREIDYRKNKGNDRVGNRLRRLRRALRRLQTGPF